VAGANRAGSTKPAIRIIAVGQRLSSWVYDTVQDYTRRMPPAWVIEWVEVKAAIRDSTATPVQWMQREAQAIETALPAQALRIILDEHGRDLTTSALAQRMQSWQESGRSPCLIIGGPDGLDAGFKAKADETYKLSSLTLPHPLVRVVLAEQLYRAWSLMTGHPYHRE
jgi:23S rRNA (pseudouridine1915-N3)-methyltransferase